MLSCCTVWLWATTCILAQHDDSLQVVNQYQQSKALLEKGYTDSAALMLNYTAEKSRSSGFWDLYTESKIALARLYQENDDIDKALKNYVELIRTLSRDSLYEPLARTYFALGNDYAEYGLDNKAIQYYSNAADFFYRSDEMEMTAETLLKMSEIYIRMEDYGSADSAMNRVVDLIDTHHLKMNIIPKLRTRVKIYEQLDQLEKMLKVNLRLLEELKDQNDPVAMVEIWSDLGYNYAGLKRYDSALSCFTESYKTLVERNAPDSLRVEGLLNIGMIYSSMKNFSTAIDTLVVAEKMCKDKGWHGRLSLALNIMAETYLKAGDLDNALDVSAGSIEAARQAGDIALLRDCYRTHSEILQESDDFREGFEYYRKYTALNDSISRMNTLRQMELSTREQKVTWRERSAILMVTNEEIEELALNNLQKEYALLSAQEELEDIAQRRKLFIVIFVSLALFFVLASIGYFAKKRDNRLLTEQKEAIMKINRELESKNKALARAMEKLKMTQGKLIESEKMASIGQLTAGIAHEINNPVNFISSSIVPLKTSVAEILEILEEYQKITKERLKEEELGRIRELEEKYDLDYMVRELDTVFSGIMEGTQRTKDIVKGLSNFSRLDKQTVRQADLHDLLDSTLLLLRNKYKERIRIRKSYATGIPLIECYPGQLSQVFMNIMNNAIQAIKDQGIIHLKTELRNIKVLVEIEDNGKGMEEKVLKKIFDPFYTTKEVGEGTGLGLSISYGIIQQHKGEIQVESTLNKGSVFRIYLPLKQTT